MKKINLIIKSTLLSTAVLFSSQSLQTYAKDEVIGGVVSTSNADTAHYIQKYQDLKTGILGEFTLDRDVEGGYHYNAYGKNLTRENQEVGISGGQFGQFKYKFEYSDLVHNKFFNAKTFYDADGIGTNRLGYTSAGGTDPVTNTSTTAPSLTTTTGWDFGFDQSVDNWNKFNAKTKRNTVGAEVELDLGTPYFVILSTSQQTKKGIKIASQVSSVPFDYNKNTSTRNSASTELPEPVDYKTADLGVEVGYRNQDVRASVSSNSSVFTNANETMTYRNPSVRGSTVMDTLSLPPSNKSTTTAVNLTWMNLPLNQSVSVKQSTVKLASDVGLIKEAVGFTNAYVGTTPAPGIPSYVTQAQTVTDEAGNSVDRFKGDITYTNTMINYTIQPNSDVWVKVSSKATKKENKSTKLTFFTPNITVAGTPVTQTESNYLGDLIGYTKSTTGADVTYRVLPHTRLGFGLASENVNRSIPKIVEIVQDKYEDSKTTKDSSYYLSVADHTVEDLSLHARYHNLSRTSSFDASPNLAAAPATTASAYAYQYFRQFDTASKKSTTMAVAADYEVNEDLSVGAEVSTNGNKFDNSVLGMNDLQTNEVYLSATYTKKGTFAVTLFTDQEQVKSNSTYRVGSAVTVSGTPNVTYPANYDPLSAAGYQYNVDATTKDTYRTVGLVVTAPVVPEKMDMTFGHEIRTSDGGKNYKLQEGALPTATVGSTTGAYAGLFQDVDSLDDYTWTITKVEGSYKVSDPLTVYFGAMSQAMNGKDSMYADFTNVFVKKAVFTGYGTDREFTSNSVYVKANYTF